MAKYRKKPVVVEAVQWDGSLVSIREMQDWAGKHWLHDHIVYFDREGKRVRWAMVNTQEGALEAKPRDWIIRGVKGEFYPCKPGIFEATYEEVD